MSATGWSVRIAKRDLVDAVGAARRRATLRRKGAGLEPDVLFVGCDLDGEDALSIPSSDAAMDVPASGAWPSPISANGPALRRLAPKLTGPDVEIAYVEGRLPLNGTSVPAREV
jgi:hypothetical protein